MHIVSFHLFVSVFVSSQSMQCMRLMTHWFAMSSDFGPNIQSEAWAELRTGGQWGATESVAGMGGWGGESRLGMVQVSATREGRMPIFQLCPVHTEPDWWISSEKKSIKPLQQTCKLTLKVKLTLPGVVTSLQNGQTWEKYPEIKVWRFIFNWVSWNQDGGLSSFRSVPKCFPWRLDCLVFTALQPCAA